MVRGCGARRRTTVSRREPPGPDRGQEASDRAIALVVKHWAERASQSLPVVIDRSRLWRKRPAASTGQGTPGPPPAPCPLISSELSPWLAPQRSTAETGGSLSPKRCTQMPASLSGRHIPSRHPHLPGIPSAGVGAGHRVVPDVRRPLQVADAACMAFSLRTHGGPDQLRDATRTRSMHTNPRPSVKFRTGADTP